MALKKDKAKVIDPVWNEGRIREFLDVIPAEDVEADFHMLMKAYRSMRAEDFATFVQMFLAEKRDINAKDPAGRTVLSYVSEHRNSAEYAETLKKAGAN